MEMPYVTCRGRDAAQNGRHESLLLLYNPSTLYLLYTFSFLSFEKVRKETTPQNDNGEEKLSTTHRGKNKPSRKKRKQGNKYFNQWSNINNPLFNQSAIMADWP